jgi:hypothetical protein
MVLSNRNSSCKQSPNSDRQDELTLDASLLLVMLRRRPLITWDELIQTGIMRLDEPHAMMFACAEIALRTRQSVLVSPIGLALANRDQKEAAHDKR